MPSTPVRYQSGSASGSGDVTVVGGVTMHSSKDKRSQSPPYVVGLGVGHQPSGTPAVLSSVRPPNAGRPCATQ